MGEQREYGRIMTAARKQRHRRWHEQNRKALAESGLTFIDRGETMLYRDTAALVFADFYPSTGRWREPGPGKTYSGGAAAFLAWLRKRVAAATAPSGEPIK